MILPVLAWIGFFSMIAQVLLMRELLVSFEGNELSLGIVLGGWLIWTGIGSAAWGVVCPQAGDTRAPCRPARFFRPRFCANAGGRAPAPVVSRTNTGGAFRPDCAGVPLPAVVTPLFPVGRAFSCCQRGPQHSYDRGPGGRPCLSARSGRRRSRGPARILSPGRDLRPCRSPPLLGLRI